MSWRQYCSGPQSAVEVHSPGPRQPPPQPPSPVEGGDVDVDEDADVDDAEVPPEPPVDVAERPSTELPHAITVPSDARTKVRTTLIVWFKAIS